MRLLPRLRSLPVLIGLCGVMPVFLLSPSFVAQAQQSSSGPPFAGPLFLELDHRTPAQMDPADVRRVEKEHARLTDEAAFFGYDLSQTGWTYDQTICPALPDPIVLHYRRTYVNGSSSVFTAVFSRSSGRVFVIPVLYRNVVPFHPAAGSSRSIDVFNRSVPAEIAVAAMQPRGPWLVLASCYADMAGGEAYVLKREGTTMELAQALLPTMRIPADNSAREIIFTDRDAPHRYTNWHLMFSPQGRLLAASTTHLSDYVPQPIRLANAALKQIPASPEPRQKPVPAGSPISTRPIPQ